MRPLRLLHDALIDHSCGERSSKPAVVVDDHEYSYAKLADQAMRLAAALIASGARRGDRVAIYMDNTWPCIVSIYAAMLAGCVFVLVNPQTKADKLAFILGDSGAVVLVTDVHLESEFTAASTRAATLRMVVCSGVMAPGVAAVGFSELIERTAPLAQPVARIAVDLAALIYTSGSTGNPKGVMQTHQAMTFTVGSLVEYLRLGSDERILLMLPVAFDYGLYQVLMAVYLGATVVIERSFTFPAQIFARMREQRVSVFPGVPTIYAMMLAAHGRQRLVFPEVTRVTNTAAHLPDQFIPSLREIFPNALIFRMYGLTECKRVCYLEPELLEHRPGSVGKAIPGTEVYLLNQDGSPTAASEVGILHVRGPHVMLGYWNRPDLSAHMLHPGALPGERVLCTHDRFRMDADGYLYFIGRTDDIIKTRGEKVSPVEVESVLHALPGILEAAVIGIPDSVLGEAIRAYVVVASATQLGEKRIRAHCLEHLENFMVPREIVIRSELPKTVTGKVSKKLLREEL